MVYVWCMKVCGRQFWSTGVNPGVCLVDGIFRQFWCMEVNSGVCLVQGNRWLVVLVYGGQLGCMFGA